MRGDTCPRASRPFGFRAMGFGARPKDSKPNRELQQRVTPNINPNTGRGKGMIGHELAILLLCSALSKISGQDPLWFCSGML